MASAVYDRDYDDHGPSRTNLWRTGGLNIWAGIRRATGRKWGFPKYIYWYFATQCLNAGSATVVDDFLARVTEDGREEP